MRFHTLLIAMTLMLVAAGASACGGEPTPVATADALSEAQERGADAREVEEATMTPLPPPEPADVTPPAEAEQVVELAIEDLAEQLGVETAEIRFISVEAVEWSDSSLGCPQPDMMYAQVITPGYKVVLEAQGENYEYHTDTATNVVLCQPDIGGTESKSAAPPAAATRGEPLADAKPPAAAQEAVKLAKEDLAKRLAVAAGVVRLVAVEAVDWSDASLGCPQPGMMYAQVITPGFLVLLEAEGQEYQYHTDQGRFAVLCEEKSQTSAATSGAVAQSEPGTLEPQDAFVSEKVTKAREDLARRLSMDVDQIRVLKVRKVTWPDSSLGCPQPGMTYAQAPQEGLLIRLGVDKEMYFYHSGGTEDPFLCEETSQVVPRVTPKTDEFVPPPDSEIDSTG